MRYTKRSWSAIGGQTMKKKQPETELQIDFATWLDSIGVLYTASCSGMRTHPVIGAKMKRMGSKKGFPDIQIFHPNRRYHGLFIELKSEKGRPSLEQIEWRDCLNYKMYCAVIMPGGLDHKQGLEWLKKTVNDYLGIK